MTADAPVAKMDVEPVVDACEQVTENEEKEERGKKQKGEEFYEYLIRVFWEKHTTRPSQTI